MQVMKTHPATRPSVRLFLLVCLLVFAGLSAAPAARGQAPEKSDAYLIGPRDLLEVRVAELPGEFDRELEVAEDGTVLLPVIGLIEARGLTEGQLAAEIRRRLEAEGLRRPTVSVRVIGFRSRPVAVLGAVMAPGQQFVPGRTTLLEILLKAGGLRADHNSRIQIRRRAANGLSDQVTISAEDLFERGDPAVNLPIFAGDLIHVPPASKIEISFLGQVKSSSVTFSSNERATLLVAIARAGGLSDDASPKIRILRRGEQGEQVEINAHYRRILAGRDQDIELQDGDIVVVKESFF